MDQFRRGIIYDQLSDISQSLLKEIYINRENFINTMNIHPLEPYIITYDESMENDDILLSIGERIGFGLDYDETNAYGPAEQFYDRYSYTIRNNAPNNISKIMDMTIQEYSNFMRNKNIISNDDMYYDRLNIDSHKYDNTLILMYNEQLPSKETTISEKLSFLDEGIVDKTVKIENVITSLDLGYGDRKEDNEIIDKFVNNLTTEEESYYDEDNYEDNKVDE